MKNKDVVSKIMMTLIAAFIFIYLGGITFRYFYSPYQTETVSETTVDETIETEALAVRNEKIIKSENKGVTVYSVSNGGKIAKGASVISYYSDDKTAAKSKQLSQMKSRIEKLEEIYTQSKNYAADLDTVSANVESNMYKLSNSVDSGDMSGAAEYRDELYYAMCKSGVTTGRTKNLDDKIKSLKNEYETLKSSAAEPDSVIKSEYSGYFVNNTDGYENAVDVSKIDELTVDSYDKLMKSKVTPTGAGKVICDTNWYLLAKLPTDKARLLTEGESIKIMMPTTGTKKLDAEVYTLNYNSAGGNALAILSLTNMDSSVCSIRNSKVKLIIDSYTGLRVNKQAVRIVNDKKGVYVKLGGMTRFRPIDIIYSGEDYVIVKTDNEDGQLKIYDDVIIKGKAVDKSNG